MHIFDNSKIWFYIFQYPLSYLEFFAVITGIIAVGLAALGKRFNFIIGIINAILYSILFYQIQLYADMFLQMYYFVMSVWGYAYWKHTNNYIQYNSLSSKQKRHLSALIIIGTILFSIIIKNLHVLLPQFFSQKASFPIFDSFISFSSIVAMYLLAKKYIENWHLWIIVNAVAIVIYALKGIIFTSLLYFIFLLIAIQAIIVWRKKQKN